MKKILFNDKYGTITFINYYILHISYFIPIFALSKTNKIRYGLYISKN